MANSKNIHLFLTREKYILYKWSGNGCELINLWIWPIYWAVNIYNIAKSQVGQHFKCVCVQFQYLYHNYLDFEVIMNTVRCIYRF